MRLNKFVPFILAVLIHLLPLGYFLLRKSPDAAIAVLPGPQGIDLAGFSTKKSPSKNHSVRSSPDIQTSSQNSALATAPTSSATEIRQDSGGTVGAANGTGGHIGESIILSAAEPVYPPLARQRGLEGTVKLKAHYNPDGTVTMVEILHSSGTKMLDESARKALMAWRIKSGHEGSFEKTFQFKLNN